MSDVREFFKRWPALYYFIANVFGPLMWAGLSAKSFLKKYPSNGKILNLGSGPYIINENVVNVDMTAYPGVSVIADVCKVPLPDESAARIVSNTVLEHVHDPVLAVAEMHRLLQKDGLAYVTVPFLYPFHFSPSDYFRWTKEGLILLFKDFEVVEIGVRAGPFSALCSYCSYTTGFIFSFGSASLNSYITNATMFIFFPIKFLDLIFNHWPEAHTVAAILYCVVRKK